MGYDMRFRKADPGEAVAVEFAQGVFHKACDVRDELPKSEKGTMNWERAKASGDYDSQDNYDGRSPRYRAAQDQVHAAYAAMMDAGRSCFRLNISGMGWARGVMEQLGMAFEDPTLPPNFPKPEEFGTDYDHADALESPEDYPDVYFTDEQTRAAVKYREAVNRHLEWHGIEIPGIPLHKFGSNDGWHVLPAEAEAAVRIWKQAYDEMGEEQARVSVALGGMERDCALDAEGNSTVDAYWSQWLRWVAYLADSVRHEGFEVH